MMDGYFEFNKVVILFISQKYKILNLLTMNFLTSNILLIRKKDPQKCSVNLYFSSSLNYF